MVKDDRASQEDRKGAAEADLLSTVMGDDAARERFRPMLQSPVTAPWLAVLRRANDDLWSREVLPAKTRALVNLATLAAVNRPDELAVRIRGLLRGGITPEEIAEVFLHTGLYCGFPAGVEANLLLAETVERLHAEGLLPTPAEPHEAIPTLETHRDATRTD
ncbi:4-carboxymuconolactone decarboxylase [Actinomadura sp. LD22]|uniref:4-carboxymuconolactone decarboxylase n=1 Tax=Actinomadura physcomitrii TaxID=2650748 RepID=A0A6I4M345_9ACTN|nr:carboxymuconolactone decarboxylase family protein [Actinomadura physcomitrii]MVZ99871.1 4-carboxymuconolactone decarboxylase [Actinomadura physcomitrii]